MKRRNTWVKLAMRDDAMVAETLLWLRHSSETFRDNLLVRSPIEMISPPVRWGNYKLRSTTAAKREKSEAARCSPKTPLLWRGSGTSVSDLYEESSGGSDCKSIGGSKGASVSEIRQRRKGKEICIYDDEGDENKIAKPTFVLPDLNMEPIEVDDDLGIVHHPFYFM